MCPFADTERRMTVEEWSALPEDAAGELVDGRLVEEEVPSYRHELIVSWLITVLSIWLRDTKGFVGGSGAKFRLGEHLGRKPDVSVFLPGRKPPPTGAVPVPPDIAVEVISADPRDVRRDRIAKMNEYAAFGVRLYWLLDPVARTLEIYELESSGVYRRALGVEAGKVGDIVGCHGLTLDLDDLWARVDALEAEEA